MLESTTSPHWPLLAELRPQLRQHVRIYPQTYRGERWYVLRDESNGRHLRFNASAYEFIGRLDGDHRVKEVWDQLVAALADEAPSQDEVVMILTQLFAIDAFRGGLSTDAKQFFNRFQQERRVRRQRTLMNPLAIRIPLLDPDRLLNRMMPWIRPLFSWTGGALWLLLVALASLLALINFPALSAAVDKDILSPANLVLMLLVFVVIKVVHEFAHAFAVKMWGGEVHEMGVTLLVLAPVPYVDASAAWGFRDKYKRILVGAIGILVELFLAAVALLVWLAVEPGLVKDVALNALLIGSVSTLLFNANPLLRFDGYYVLQDLIEIPNLASRSNRYYLYLIQRYLFGLDNAQSPVMARGESIWFAVYGLAAFCYRLLIMAVIVLFLAEQYLVVGIALGCWAVFMQLIMPLSRGIRFLFANPALVGKRFRAASVSMLLLAAVGGGLVFQPVTLTTDAVGVVWVSDQAQVYAGTDGFVSEVLVPSGTEIEAGTAVIQMHAPSLQANIAKLEARRRELQIRGAAERIQQRVQSDITQEELQAVEAELALLREQSTTLRVRSEVAGTFVLPQGSSLKGHYLHQGQLIGYVISPERLIVRTVIPQADIGLVRQQVAKVEVRLAERLGQSVDVDIVRETPAASRSLPSRALGAAGGGDIAVNGTDEGGVTAAEKVFQIDLGLPADVRISGVGERAYVRFDHGAEPLASQWVRSVRQLLLSRLSF